MQDPRLAREDDRLHPEEGVDRIAVYSSNFVGSDLPTRNFETYSRQVNLVGIIAETKVWVALS